ncbi:MAG TPA: hypothetical protein VMS96_04470 [Terriglobales bacterium]|nr:hypothetical protein [Terriglobales bacterium]
MDVWVEAFIVIAAVAIVLQLAVLSAMALSIKKTTEQLTKMVSDVQSRTLPILETTNSILSDTKPRLDIITNNLTETSVIVKKQMQRLESTMDDIVDRTRLQVIRADEMVTRTLDRVEETTDVVHHTVISPVRQVSAVVQGITSALGVFMGSDKRRKRKEGERARKATQDEELFI